MLGEVSEVVRNIRKLFKRQRMGLLRGNLHAVDGAVDLLCNHRADVMAVIRGVVDFVRTRTVVGHHPSDLVHVLAEGLVVNGFQQPLSEQRRYIRWGNSFVLHRSFDAAHAVQDTASVVDLVCDAILVCDRCCPVCVFHPVGTVTAVQLFSGECIVQEIQSVCTGNFIVFTFSVQPNRPNSSTIFRTSVRAS